MKPGIRNTIHKPEVPNSISDHEKPFIDLRLREPESDKQGSFTGFLYQDASVLRKRSNLLRKYSQTFVGNPFRRLWKFSTVAEKLGVRME
ncbi:Hypothetical predicted protein [Octopus vulgaris]|uniref:Uncharacterized protein n=1 Tax=Octopus vulgaris TaxID=6645 RepID=A0AA36B5K5_OCTVU|nr:Hypothetical predicted protein [Octopus vulgaris]